MNGTVFLVLWAIQIGVGAWIGHYKGRTGLGILLGAVLGVIGWIIIASIRPTFDERVRREGLNRAVKAAVDNPNTFNLPADVSGMTSAEQQAYIKHGTVPARFQEDTDVDQSD